MEEQVLQENPEPLPQTEAVSAAPKAKNVKAFIRTTILDVFICFISALLVSASLFIFPTITPLRPAA